MRTFDLNVKDRMILLSFLPTQGSYLDLVVRQELIEKIKFTSQDIQDLNIREEKGVTTWTDNQSEIAVELSNVHIEAIKKQFKKLNDESLLHLDHLDLYQKFHS
jgi:hypothetical protein